MFKIGSFDEEIFQSMNKNLENKIAENKREHISKASGFLKAASEIFAEYNLSEEANEVKEILFKLNRLVDQ